MSQEFQPMTVMADVLRDAHSRLLDVEAGFGYLQEGNIYDADGPPIFPHYVLPSSGTRKDKEQPTPTQFYRSVMSERDTRECTPHGADLLAGCITTVPSPHFPPYKGSNETHLVGWWWRKAEHGEVTRQDMLGLARDPKMYGQGAAMLAGLMRDGIDRICDTFQLSREQALDQLKVYGLTGHATPEERAQGDTSRGSQSAENGHINFALKEKDALASVTTIKTPTTRDYMKSVDPFSTAVVRRYNGTLIEHFRKVGAEVGMGVSCEEVHIVRNDKENDTRNPVVRFAENIDFAFDKPASLEEGFGALLKVLGHTDALYTQAYNAYIEYWRTGSITYTDEMQKSPLMRMILEDIPTFPPTYGLIKKLLGDVNNPPSEKQASVLLMYQERFDLLKDRLKDEDRRAKAVQTLQKRYHLDPYSAQSIIDSFIADQLADPEEKLKDNKQRWETIEFIASKYFPSSYRINWGCDESGTLVMNGFSISPHIASVKGGAEDLNGGVIVREKGR